MAQANRLVTARRAILQPPDSKDNEWNDCQLRDEFLDRLSLLTRSNPQRTERLWRVLWHCYFDSEEPSQLEIAEMVGISDSSISDYRRKIESEMRCLNFSPDRLSSFAEELDEQLRWRLSLPERTQRRPELGEQIAWTNYKQDAPPSFQPVLVN